MKRYGIVTEKLPREVVLLQSIGGCSYGKCAYCDYKDDYAPTALSAIAVNRAALDNVTGTSSVLEVLNSASFSELPADNILDIFDICQKHSINTLITEQYWAFRGAIPRYKTMFGRIGVDIKFICGVETFDENYRENVLKKGMPNVSAEKIALYYSWVNLLFGITGQSLDKLKQDIDMAFSLFERVNLCIFENNTTNLKRDNRLINELYNSAFFAELKNNPRIEILDYADDRAPDKLGGVP
jgi:hypothetical protein